VWSDVHLLIAGLISAGVSAVVSALVSWLFGPSLIIRQEKARRALDLRNDMYRALQELLRHLKNDELQRLALESGKESVRRWTISDYQRMLWPVVRALDNPDLPERLALGLRPLVKTFLGSWRMEYLSICVTPDLENALDRYPIQPIQPRHLEEAASLIERLTGTELSASAPASDAIAKVEEMLQLLR
jgi:hypothetical protein